jgi:uncharacterized protein DUF5624
VTNVVYTPHEFFRSLYDAYTGPGSTGLHLTQHMVGLTARDPILVVTGSDFVIFPGGGQPPIVESFRNSTRGFVELTSISHLGPAVAWIFRMRELGDADWRNDAERLIARMDKVRRINTESYWRDVVAVEAWRGDEARIADLVDYSCAVTTSFLTDCLADESRMTFENLRQSYLDPVGHSHVPVPINDMMVATFALAYLDIAHRVISWLRAQAFDWSKLMVLLSGRSGRATAGLTWATNNNCHLLWRASEKRLPPENLHIAPHGPSLALSDLDDKARTAELESQFRGLALHLRANVDVARRMFEGYPSFEKSIDEPPVIEPNTRSLHAMPRLRSPDDRVTAITRLRFVMEDPAQLLSNSVAHFIIDQLCEHDNQPSQVVIPGFSNITYPRRDRVSQ